MLLLWEELLRSPTHPRSRVLACHLALPHCHRAVTRRAQIKAEPPGTQACVERGVDPIPHPFSQAVLGFVATPFLFLGVSGCLCARDFHSTYLMLPPTGAQVHCPVDGLRTPRLRAVSCLRAGTTWDLFSTTPGKLDRSKNTREAWQIFDQMN